MWPWTGSLKTCEARKILSGPSRGRKALGARAAMMRRQKAQPLVGDVVLYAG